MLSEKANQGVEPSIHSTEEPKEAMFCLKKRLARVWNFDTFDGLAAKNHVLRMEKTNQGLKSLINLTDGPQEATFYIRNMTTKV